QANTAAVEARIFTCQSVRIHRAGCRRPIYRIMTEGARSIALLSSRGFALSIAYLLPPRDLLDSWRCMGAQISTAPLPVINGSGASPPHRGGCCFVKLPTAASVFAGSAVPVPGPFPRIFRARRGPPMPPRWKGPSDNTTTPLPGNVAVTEELPFEHGSRALAESVRLRGFRPRCTALLPGPAELRQL